jgi:hypothetical protein
MSGVGGMHGAMGDGSNGGHPQGTEYTLQGGCALNSDLNEDGLTIDE